MPKKSAALRTSKGNVTATARAKYGTIGKKFPVFDAKSAKSALHLKGFATPAQQKVIKAKAAKFVKGKAGKK